MSWSIGYDSDWGRDVGYGVPAYCDHPGCMAEIDRGLGCVCGGEPYGGEHGCGLYFCSKHLGLHEVEPPRRKCHSPAVAQQCERCAKGALPFDPKPEHPKWIHWKLTDASWKEWRNENPETVGQLKEQLNQPVF